MMVMLVLGFCFKGTGKCDLVAFETQSAVLVKLFGRNGLQKVNELLMC